MSGPNKAWKNLIKIIAYAVAYIATFLMIYVSFVFKSNTLYDFSIMRTIIIVFASILLIKYFIYMLVSPWHDVWSAVKFGMDKEDQKYNPKVSVLIPAWNEEVGLLSTVKSLLSSTYQNMEIIVVNDGSTDDSDCIMRSFLKSFKHVDPNRKIDMIYKYKPNGGKGNALNTAIGLSSGEIIISIDADCYVRSDAIENFVKYFRDPKVMGAVGNVKIGNVNNLLGIIQYLEFLFSFYFKKTDSLMNTIYIIGGAAGAFRKEVFDKIGLYNATNITEDIELSVRMQNAGMKIVYASDAIVYTEGATELNGLQKQRLRWKRGRFETFAQFKHLFFSINKKHNKLLSWVVLPLAIFGDLQLSLEIIFLLFLYIYAILVHDSSSFISGIIIVSSMFFVQMAFDDRKSRTLFFFFLAPIGWMLFYITTFVESNALFKSLYGYLRKQELKWQNWQRSGIRDEVSLID